MTARKRKRPSDFTPRVNAALDRIAATIEYGELMLATDQPAFFEAVADKLEARHTVAVVAIGRDLDGLPSTGPACDVVSTAAPLGFIAVGEVTQ